MSVIWISSRNFTWQSSKWPTEFTSPGLSKRIFFAHWKCGFTLLIWPSAKKIRLPNNWAVSQWHKLLGKKFRILSTGVDQTYVYMTFWKSVRCSTIALQGSYTLYLCVLVNNYSNTTQKTVIQSSGQTKARAMSSSQLSSSFMRSHAFKFEPYHTFLKSYQEFSLILPKHSLTAEENIYLATLTLNSLFLPFGPGL